MKHSRRGFSLVEILVVVALGTAIMAMAGVLATSLLGLRSARRAEHAMNRALLALHQQWRADVRGTTQMAVGQDGAVVSLTLPEGKSVEYRQERTVLCRTAYARNKLAGRERYLLPEGAHVDCLGPGSPRTIATLAITYVATPTSGRAPRIRPLQGIVGGDGRWQSPSGSSAAKGGK